MSGFQGLSDLSSVDQALPKPTIDAKTASASDSQAGATCLTKEFFGIPTAVPESLLDFTAVAALLGFSEAILADCDRKNLPARKLPPLPKYVIVNTEAGPAKEEAAAAKQTRRLPEHGEWTAEKPYFAPVINATWLTHSARTASNIAARKETWGVARRVVQVDIGISDSQIQYMPGDSFGILAPNPAYLVEALYGRTMRVQGTESIETDSCSAGDAISLESTIEMGTCSKISCTLRELLTYKLDLSSLPRKNNAYALAQYCHDPQEKRCLEWLCSKCPVGKEIWKQFVEEQGLGFGELVLLFPSCMLPLGAVIAYSGPAVPRYYSVASSPLVHCQHISIAFSIVHRKCNMACKPDQEIRRAGLCTSYIEWASRQYLYAGLAGVDPEAASVGAASPQLRIFHKPNMTFHLPGSVAPPLILIGPGTGVAPFVGFLHHRTAIEAMRLKSCDDACEGVWRGGFEIEEEDLPGESSNVHQFISETLPGPIHLFFGCRNEDDYLYKNDLQEKLSSGALQTLEVAMSRTQNDKIYVTHLLNQRGAEMARLLVDEGAYVYVCGDGNHMAKDVNTTFLQILQEHAGLSEACAIEKIANLKLKRRYVQDIWS
jgi:sulfite reductase alpha subunit-like flavoprotein